jgi:purine nucleoside phosphorylase
MPVAIITGSGTHALRGFEQAQSLPVSTPYGEVEVSAGEFAGAEVLHVSRHGGGHVRLSHHVTHRANIWALHSLGASAVLACTACGAVDRTLSLGALVVFDDLHFISNRLPDGSLCTFFDTPGEAGRGHWVLHGGPFSAALRTALVVGAAESGHTAREGGTYGHVDGPRFNTPSEIASLGASGVVAVSQTAGPETVLCGELELPYALIGFVTDHANEVIPGEPTPVSTLASLMASSSAVFADVLERAVRRVVDESRSRSTVAPAGFMLRFNEPG